MNKVLTEIIPRKSSNDATEDYQKSYDTEQKHCNCDICRWIQQLLQQETLKKRNKQNYTTEIAKFVVACTQ